METLSKVIMSSSSSSLLGKAANLNGYQPTFLSNFSSFHHSPLSTPRTSLTVSVLKSPSSASQCAEEDVLREFFRDRHMEGDIITKYSDIIFQKGVMRFIDDETANVENSSQPTKEVMTGEPEEGFLKLTSTQEWLMGETSAPINRKPTNKDAQNDRERRRRLNFLRYEAFKQELVFMTLGIGAACTGYCLLTLSVQAAVSYASGVGFSYLYLQLLYQQADNISKDSIPQIFQQKKQKKIGIRSEDLRDSFEKTIKGSGIALSSPRLVIPAAIYGLWVLLHQNFASDLFDFQIVPAMLGLFAYKAAALIQVYRDNEDLQLIFPDTEESPDG